MDGKDYVLGKLSIEEQKKIKEVMDHQKVFHIDQYLEKSMTRKASDQDA